MNEADPTSSSHPPSDESSLTDIVPVLVLADPPRPPQVVFTPAPRRNPLLIAWRRLGGGSLALSLLIHLGILLAAGLVVFTTTTRQDKVDFLPGGGSSDSQQASQALAHKVQQKRQKTLTKAIPKQRLVSTNLNAAISLPDAPPDLLDVPDVSSLFSGSRGSLGHSAASLGTGFGPGFGSGSMSGITFQPITMFGQELKDTRRIAVVMDVSRSMTKYLPAVVKELDKIARQSVLVLYFGCGLTQPKSRIEDKVRKTTGDDFATFWQNWEGKASLKLTPEERRKLSYDSSLPMPLESIYKKLADRPGTFYINFNGITYTQSALMSHEVMEADTIYWFADFQDAVDEDTMDQVRRRLKTRKQKLFIHASTRGRSFEKVVESLVTPLGGQVIEAEVKAAK